MEIFSLKKELRRLKGADRKENVGALVMYVTVYVNVMVSFCALFFSPGAVGHQPEGSKGVEAERGFGLNDLCRLLQQD